MVDISVPGFRFGVGLVLATSALYFPVYLWSVIGFRNYHSWFEEHASYHPISYIDNDCQIEKPFMNPNIQINRPHLEPMKPRKAITKFGYQDLETSNYETGNRKKRQEKRKNITLRHHSIREMHHDSNGRLQGHCTGTSKTPCLQRKGRKENYKTSTRRTWGRQTCGGMEGDSI